MDAASVELHRHESSRRFVIGAISIVVALYVAWMALVQGGHAAAANDHAHEAAADSHHSSGEAEHHAAAPAPAFWSVIPFCGLLGAIALFPLLHKTSHWWEHNQNKFIVASALGIVTLAYYAFLYGHGVHDHFTHTDSSPGLGTAATVLKNAILGEYVPFMTLLFSLYVISGGVAIEGRLVGRPVLNTSILGIGGLLASFVGTTGAAMLLIRPLLKANANRRYVAHSVIFFTFIVCNTGGCLLPIGDPPLFLGYLKGVPFLWTLNLWKEWAFINVALLSIYFVWDSVRYRHEDPNTCEPNGVEGQRFGIRGAVNFLWLAGVIGAVALLDPSKPFPGTSWHAPLYFREMVMLSLTAISLWTTSVQIRQANSFSYGAILEVAALFCGIFVCMQAPIQILNLYGGSLGFDQPWKYFWGAGMLSSFLDNAPTYVVFFETAKAAGGDSTNLVPVVNIDYATLVAISLGAVFMGANTYIGNGPNFMVKAIAEANNVRMPSFFGYMAYSCTILVPLFVLMTWLFVG